MTTPNFTAVISSPIGKLGIQTQADKLRLLRFLAPDHAEKPPTDKLNQQVCNELAAYFKNPKHQFTIPVHTTGTPFQQRVWTALCKIPLGKSLTYQALAQKLTTGPRAIGGACRANPVPLIVPCHRVVAKNNLGGFAGHTDGSWLTIKKWLLDHEA